MDAVITEQNYSIETRWIFKSILGSILTVLIITPFFLLGFKDKDGELSFLLIIYIGLIPFSLVLAILRKITFHYFIEDKFLTLK